MNKKLETLFQENVKNKVILITGASSGIGLTVAKKMASAGAHVLLVARTQDTLQQVQTEIVQAGGKASIFPCDLSDMEAIDRVAKEIIQKVEHIDILINNAGRSIRRAVHESIDRFHDFERTMQLNYFGAVRLVLNVLPHMINRKGGQIINISSIGVLVMQLVFRLMWHLKLHWMHLAVVYLLKCILIKFRLPRFTCLWFVHQ